MANEEVEIKPSSRYHTEGEPEACLVLRRQMPVASVREKAIENVSLRPRFGDRS